MKTNASKSKSSPDNAMLALTPMIDVVFLLLVFFVVTLRQNDISAQLDALRPQLSEIHGHTEPLTISIGPRGFYYNGATVTESRLRENMTRIARVNPGMDVVIKCTEDSAHGSLVRALDICNEAGLRKIAVLSM